MTEPKILCDKISYTREEAMSCAAGMNRAKGKSMKAYKCRECGNYHLATKGKKTPFLKSHSTQLNNDVVVLTKKEKKKKSKYKNIPAVQKMIIQIKNKK